MNESDKSVMIKKQQNLTKQNLKLCLIINISFFFWLGASLTQHQRPFNQQLTGPTNEAYIRRDIEGY